LNDLFSKSKGGKQTKSCSDCLASRSLKRETKKTEPVERSSNDRKITLTERVNKDVLNYILKNNEILEIGSSFVGGELISGKAQMSLLLGYYESLNSQGEHKVKYSQRASSGRYYGKCNLQLQNISRKIRHSICKDTMVDIDMSNAHPTLLRWYCNTNGIDCSGLNYYIDNRNLCLSDLIILRDQSKDEVKRDLLAIINGREKSVNELIASPVWYNQFYSNMRLIISEVSVKEPVLYDRAKLSKQNQSNGNFNIGGTCINYLMQSLENKALMTAYDTCTSRNVQVSALVYDGLMIYRNDHNQGDIEALLAQITIDVSSCFFGGIDIQWLEKPMLEGIDIPINLSPVDLGSLKSQDPALDFLFDMRETQYVRIDNVSTDESPNFVQDLVWDDNFPILAIKSVMGSGKTSSICRWISENNPKRVLVLSPRISFAKSVCHEYNEKITGDDQVDFRCYTDINKKSRGKYDRLILSMESLHSIEFEETRPFDLLVIDECQANLSSHTNTKTNGKNFSANTDTLHRLMQNTAKIVMCDAFLNRKTIQFLSDQELPTKLLNYQMEMQPRDATVICNKCLDTLYPLIESGLGEGKRSYVFVSSASRCKIWANNLRTKYPDKKIIDYTQGEGKNILNVREEWGDAHCILTTSTITVGINFDIKDYFHNCYISISSRACNTVVDIFQSHYRVRHLIDNQIFLHISDNAWNKPSTDEAVLTQNLKWFETNQIEMYTMFEKAPDYLIKLLALNQLEINLSASLLTGSVYAFLEACNYTIHTRESLDDDIDLDVDIADDTVLFSDIIIISRSEFVELQIKKSKGIFLTLVEKERFNKFLFIDFFTDGDTKNWRCDESDQLMWTAWNKFKKTKMSNIKNEKLVRENITTIEELYRKQFDVNCFAVMSNNSIRKVVEMTNICSHLGLDNSQSVGSVISSETMSKYFDIIRNDHYTLRKVFDLTDCRDNKNIMNEKNCLDLVNSIAKCFGFVKILKTRSRTVLNGERIEGGESYVISPHRDGIPDGDHLGKFIYEGVSFSTPVESTPSNNTTMITSNHYGSKPPM
tara:strand:+ start:5369 stop:8515 length:3147 start_codon:yes stop_codon:yes gene_type:complete